MMDASAGFASLRDFSSTGFTNTYSCVSAGLGSLQGLLYISPIFLSFQGLAVKEAEVSVSLVQNVVINWEN